MTGETTITLADPSLASSFDAISGLQEPLTEALPDTRWYVVGGLATAALRHPQTVIHPEGVIEATRHADTFVTRPNGTLRDVDILVDDVLAPEIMQHAKRVAEEVVDGRLEVSLFGFDDAVKHAGDKLSFLSRRVRDANGQRYHQLGPVRQPVPSESYEPWKLVLPNKTEVPVLHPVGHLLAYRSRSISGLRPKDTQKFYEMANNIFSQQVFRDELKYGAFASWNQFANTIAAIRHGGKASQEIVPADTPRAEIFAMRWQGRLLKMLEANPKIVDVCQSAFMQRIFSSIVRSA